MTAVPPEAVDAAVAAIERALMSGTLYAASVVESDAYYRVALEAAAPHIRAQVYAEIRQLATEVGAEYRTPACTNPGCPEVWGEHVHKLPFAELIPGGELSG